MQRHWLKIVCIASLLLLGLMWSLHHLRLGVESKLRSFLAREHMTLHESDIHLVWFGLRLDNVQLEGHGLSASGALEVQLDPWPGRGFAQPKQLVLEAWHLRWVRRSEPTPSRSEPNAQPTSQPLASKVQSLLQSFVKLGLSLDVRHASLEILDSQRKELVSIPSLHFTYSGDARDLQVKIAAVSYRQKKLFKSLEGQVILQNPHSQFPFLLSAVDSSDASWQLQGALSGDFDTIELRHKRSGLPADWRPYLPLVAPLDSLQLLIKLKVKGLMEHEKLSFDVQLASNNLQLAHPFLGEIAWGPFPLSLRTKGFLQLETGYLQFSSGIIHLLASQHEAPLRLLFSGSKPDLLTPLSVQPLRLQVALPDTPCQILLDGLPAHAFPLLEGFTLRGSMKGSAQLQILDRNEPLFQLGSRTFGCQLNQVPPRFSPGWLRRRDSKSVSAKELREQPALAAFLGHDFVPISQIAAPFLQGLVSSEDGGFWHHEGFSLGTLQAALQANLKAGKVLYGGSTITMQLVKNLYLDGDRVLSRKVQELYLAWALEHVLRKDEILEIYANIVEFGPGIRGIGKASQVYFGKHPRDLDPAEGLFLASILPSPHRYFVDTFCVGRLNESVLERMQKAALGASVMAKQAGWMEQYQSSLHRFRFSDLDTGACRRTLSQSGSKRRDGRSF